MQKVRPQNETKRDRNLFCAFLLALFCLYLLWAIVVPTSGAPDEKDRLLLSDYIFKYGTLPNGWDERVRIPLWGFSYAFYPYTTGIIGAFFMKIASVFTSAPHVLLVAARMPSVLSGLVTVTFCYKLGRKLSLARAYRWMFIFLLALLPQFSFLCGYVNNDVFAMMTTTMIVYYWAAGISDNWSWSTCVKLAGALALCFLSYYNAYAYILCSVPLFILSQLCRPFRMQEVWTILKKGCLIVGIVFAIAGWWFIRNAILYDGDILGRATLRACGEKYANQAFVAGRLTMREKGYTLIGMLFPPGSWIFLTYRSFIGMFGYMNLPMRSFVYAGVMTLYCGAMVSLVLGKLVQIKRRGKLCAQGENQRGLRLLFFWMFAAMVIVVVCSIWYSYTSDYQPQGRYLMPAASSFFLAVTYGVHRFDDALAGAFRKRAAWVHVVCPVAVCVCMVLLQIYAMTRIILPTYLAG